MWWSRSITLKLTDNKPLVIPKTELKNNQPVNISTWKTYRNEEYGFEFKYPDDWILGDEKSLVDFANKLLLIIDVSEKGYQHLNGLRSFGVTISPNNTALRETLHKQPTIVDGIETTAYFFPNGWECYNSKPGDDCSFFNIPVQRKKLWYNLEANGSAQSIGSEFNQILSTFRFIE